MLLRRATLLLYTPDSEHFGIVPLEAMAAGVPVLAAATGGPTETVIDGETGWLRDTQDICGWADIIGQVVSGSITEHELQRMGAAGAARVRSSFGQDALAERLDTLLHEMSLNNDGKSPAMPSAITPTVVVLALVGALIGMAILAFKALSDARQLRAYNILQV